LLYIKASSARRITAAEMKYMRKTARYTWRDYKTNTQVANELKITQILNKLLEYKRSWIQHVNRIPRNGLPRVMKHYSPTGRRNHGRSLKRRETGTGQQVAQLRDRYEDDDDDDDDDDRPRMRLSHVKSQGFEPRVNAGVSFDLRHIYQ